MSIREPTALEIHKALADDTRFRLYRYLGLSGRPVSVRELSTRLSLHPNTLRPQLRRLEEAGLVRREIRKGATVGRPQTMYAAVERTVGDRRGAQLLEPGDPCGKHRGLLMDSEHDLVVARAAIRPSVAQPLRQLDLIPVPPRVELA